MNQAKCEWEWIEGSVYRLIREFSQDRYTYELDMAAFTVCPEFADHGGTWHIRRDTSELWMQEGYFQCSNGVIPDWFPISDCHEYEEIYQHYLLNYIVF